MAEDRNTLEQEAIAHLGKGKAEDALKCYQSILRIEPRDIRVRQKIADLYMQLGKKPEAMRQLREVAIGHIGEEQHRQALVVLKQLQKLKPKDDEVHGLLGDCYKAVGFIPDAREAYEKTLELLETTPKEALPYAAKLVSIAPGEMPPKINLAELLQRVGKVEEAAAAWKKLAGESRRRGNASDQAKFNEYSLRLNEEDLDCLEGAAEARIALGEPKEALVHIQKAYAENPSSEQVLSMLAQCFELMEQQPKAKKVLLQLAKLHQDANQPVGRRDALKRAFACDPEDSSLEAQVGAAVSRAERCEMRLTDHKWSLPSNEVEGLVVVEAEVLCKYGFADRAKAVIEAASDDVRVSLSARARMVEVLVALADNEGALAELGALGAAAGGDSGVLSAVQTRTGALRGDFDVQSDSDDAVLEMEEEEEVVELDIEDEAEEASDDGGDGDPEARGDALVASGDLQGAMAAYQQALAADPANEEVLMKLGEIVAGGDDAGGSAADPEPEPMELPAEALTPVEETSSGGEMPDFGNIFQKGDSEAAPAPSAAPPAPVPAAPTPVAAGDDVVGEARARLLVGLHAEAISMLDGRTDLVSATLSGEARLASGEADAGRKALRRVLDESAESDAGYAEALWILARLQAIAGKGKAAGRTLDDLEDLDSGYRAVEIVALRRGIAVIKG